jgi:hypothetical protein
VFGYFGKYISELQVDYGNDYSSTALDKSYVAPILTGISAGATFFLLVVYRHQVAAQASQCAGSVSKTLGWGRRDDTETLLPQYKDEQTTSINADNPNVVVSPV